MDEISIPSEMARDIRQAMERNHSAAKERRKLEMETFNNALAGLERREDELYDDLRRGILDDESLTSEKAIFSNLHSNVRRDRTTAGSPGTLRKRRN